MKKIILFFAVATIFLNYSILNAQTYNTGFDNSAEQAGWAAYRVGVIDPFYKWEYSAFSAHSAPKCLIHYYPVGGSEVTDDWFVSPVFDFSEGGKIDSLWHNFSGFGTPMAGDTVAIYVLNGSADPELATSKIMLYNYTDTSYVNDNVWRLDQDIEIPNLAGESYIAFRYKTISNWLDVRFDDISISANETTGIFNPNHNISLVQIFPNPAQDFVSIKYSEGLEIINITLFDITGKEIRAFSGSKNTLNLGGLKRGSYILKINTDQGLSTQKMILN